MIISSDIVFKTKEWAALANYVVDKYNLIPNYVTLFVICAAIGINEGKKLEIVKDTSVGVNEINLPRAVLLQRLNNDNLEFLFQAYIFSSDDIKDVDEKIDIAFRDAEEKKMKKIEPLKQFANYGAKRMHESISNYENPYGIMEELFSLFEEKVTDPESLLGFFDVDIDSLDV